MPKYVRTNLPKFGVPYPMMTAIGRQQADEFRNAAAEQLGKLYTHAMKFGHDEAQAAAGPLMDLYGRVMYPAEQLINAAKGNLGVLHAGLAGWAQRKIMDAQEALFGLQNKAALPIARFAGGGGAPGQPPGPLPPKIVHPVPPTVPPFFSYDPRFQRDLPTNGNGGPISTIPYPVSPPPPPPGCCPT